MTLDDVLAIVGALGLGALIPKLFDIYSNERKNRSQSRHEFKQVRYKAIILLMYTYLDFDERNTLLLAHNRNFRTKKDLLEELFTEWTNMTLFASDNVIRTMKAFVKNPSEDSYLTVTLAMRKDLYNVKTSLTISDLKIDSL